MVTCFNCLNVLTDKDLHDTIEVLHTHATRGNNGKGCSVLISVYEGDRKGHGRPTMKGASYQRNEKAATYLPALKARFSSVKRSRGLFICTP